MADTEKDDALLYYCPTADEVESATHGGFDPCCGKPELHVYLPDSPGTQALSELLSQRQRDIHAAQSQADDELREQYAAQVHKALRDYGEGDEDPGTGSDYGDQAAVVMRVRDRRMEQLAAGRQTWKTKALEMERDRDRIAAERDQARPLVPMFDGLQRLLATSSKDWGACREDAWLWAVLVGWDCEEDHEHDDLCDDGGAMQEIAERYGWSPEAVAKARRYRAAIRSILDLPDAEQPVREAS